MFFHPQKELRVYQKHLPHWRQEDVIYFITSRLSDSMPQEKLQQWKRLRQAWLQDHGLSSMDALPTLPEPLQQEFHRKFTVIWHRWLDKGWGDCCLRQPDARQCLIDQFSHHNSEAANLDAWVIMPNHFHALVHVTHPDGLGRVVQHWKGGSARAINKLTGRQGSLWQQEPYDHIVRSEGQLRHYRRYIAANPVKACLKPSTYAVGFGSNVCNAIDSLQHFLGDSPQPSDCSD